MTRFPFPYPRVVAPAAEIEWAQRDNPRWFGEQGLLDDPATAGRCERWGVALLAGLMYPHARGPDLALATHVPGLMFDHEFDSPLGVQPPRAVRMCEDMTRVVSPSTERHVSGSPLVRVARSLWESACGGMPPQWWTRTAPAWEAFAGAPALDQEGDVEVNNLVTAARQYHGLSTGQAIGDVADVVSRDVEEFAGLETSSWGPPATSTPGSPLRPARLPRLRRPRDS